MSTVQKLPFTTASHRQYNVTSRCRTTAIPQSAAISERAWYLHTTLDICTSERTFGFYCDANGEKRFQGDGTVESEFFSDFWNLGASTDDCAGECEEKCTCEGTTDEDAMDIEPKPW